MFPSWSSRYSFISCILYSGNHLRSLKRSQSTGKLLLPQPLNVAVSPNGETIYVIDREKGIVTLDRHGVHVTCLSSPDIPEPRGVCVDSTGNVVITCQQSNSLVQVLMDGKEFKVLATGSGLLHRPNAVYIDERKSRVIVSMTANQMVAVFNINWRFYNLSWQFLKDILCAFWL